MQKKNNKYNLIHTLLIPNFFRVLFVYIWLYTFILAVVWGFFVVLKMHAYKFKNFSKNITRMTNILLIFLIILSLVWYVLVYFIWSWEGWNYEVDRSSSYDEVYY